MDKMCVYCEGVFTSDTIVCPNCNEYDGMMPLESAIDYLHLDPNDYLDGEKCWKRLNTNYLTSIPHSLCVWLLKNFTLTIPMMKSHL